MKKGKLYWSRTNLGGRKITKITIEFLCSRKLTLDLVSGQYQDAYYGEYECGRKWSLEEISEALAEIEDCGTGCARK